MTIQPLPGLCPSAFVHPVDRKTLAALRSAPGIETALKALMNVSIEDQFLYHQNQTAIRLGRTQYPSLYRMVEDAVAVLDTPMPEVFLDTGYVINAYAFGFKQFAVVLPSGTIDFLDDNQLRSVIGHEVGHIACEHMVYKTMAELLRMAGDQILGGLLGSAGFAVTASLRLALLKWSRAAEFSCDRAALLVVRDPEVVASTLCSLAGRSSRFASEFSLEAVLEQSAMAEQQAGLYASVTDFIRQSQLTHPDPVSRARAIMDWSRSAEYAAIIEGRYPRRAAASAPLSPNSVELDWEVDAETDRL